jgi:hypothetical protein
MISLQIMQMIFTARSAFPLTGRLLPDLSIGASALVGRSRIGRSGPVTDRSEARSVDVLVRRA